MSVKLIVSALLATTAILATMSYLEPRSKAQSADLERFIKFKREFGKSYASPRENEYRFQVFRDTLRTIAAHDNPSYTLGVNQFSDLTFAEFSSLYLMDGIQAAGVEAVNKCSARYSPLDQKSGSAVDWVAEGKVQKVKNQAHCGSCWAFSTVGSIESAYSIAKNQMPDLSEQELVDCANGRYGNMGCNGGVMPWAFSYVLDNGVHTEAEYAYKGVDGACQAGSLAAPTHSISGCSMVGRTTSALTEALRSQPVSVAFYVQQDFMSYSGGVYKPWLCWGQPNHAVLAVGFDLSASTPYYKVKNSWDVTWGEQGYFRIAIGYESSGTCHIAGSGMSSVPVV